MIRIMRRSEFRVTDCPSLSDYLSKNWDILKKFITAVPWNSVEVGTTATPSKCR